MQPRSRRNDNQYGIHAHHDTSANVSREKNKKIQVLMNQNKKLRLELDSARIIIQQVAAGKTKYKQKYKKLKKQIEVQGHIQRPAIRRENSGKIYSQTKLNNKLEVISRIQNVGVISPKQNPPSSGQPFIQQHFQQNQYGMSPQIKLNDLQKISDGVEMISERVKKISIGWQFNENQITKLLKKMQKVQQSLSNQICEIKEYFSNFKSFKNSDKKVTIGKQQSRQKSYSDKQNLMRNDSNQQNESPVKDQPNCEQNTGRIQIKVTPDRLKKSRSHRSFHQIKKLLAEQAGEKKREQKQGSESESTKSKWQMLNFIGKRLENFKFEKYNSESELLDSDQRVNNA